MKICLFFIVIKNINVVGFMSKKGSKNDTKNRGKGGALRLYNGKTVKPFPYKGQSVGHGNYIAARYEDGSIVFDSEGKPIPYNSCLAGSSVS